MVDFHSVKKLASFIIFHPENVKMNRALHGGAKRYFSSLTTADLQKVSVEFQSFSPFFRRLPLERQVELLNATLSELNRRGLFDVAMRIVLPLVGNPNSPLRIYNPSDQGVSDLLGQVASSILANRFLQGAGKGEQLLINTMALSDTYQLRCMQRLGKIIQHSGTRMVQAISDVSDQLRLQGSGEYDFSNYNSHESSLMPVVTALSEFYLSHPHCEKFFPHWLRVDPEARVFYGRELDTLRIPQKKIHVKDFFDSHGRAQFSALERLGEWGIGSTNEEITTLLNLIAYSVNDAPSSWLLGGRVNCTPVEKLRAQACRGDLLKCHLRVFLHCMRREPESAFDAAEDALNIALNYEHVGSVNDIDAYREYKEDALKRNISWSALPYWAPTSALRHLINYVLRHRELRQEERMQEFAKRVESYNFIRSNANKPDQRVMTVRKWTRGDSLAM